MGNHIAQFKGEAV